MPYGIIDDFEVVNVDKGNRKRGASGCTALKRIAQAIAKYGAVGQLGKFVVCRQKFNAALSNGNFFYVGKHADIVGDCASQVAYHLDIKPFKIVRAVFFAVPYFALPPAGREQLIPHMSVKFLVVAARCQFARCFANYILL